MPWVTINMLAGRGSEMKKELHQQVARAVYETLNISPDLVKIQIVEMQNEDHSSGGIQVQDSPK